MPQHLAIVMKSDEEVDQFYEDIQSLLWRGLVHYNIVMGDFIAETGKRVTGESALGNHGVDSWNKRGHFCWLCWKSFTCLWIYSLTKVHQKWSWKYPSEVTTVIDFILTNRFDIMKNAIVLNRVNVGCNHRIRAEVKINHLDKIRLLQILLLCWIKDPFFQSGFKTDMQPLNNEKNLCIEKINKNFTKILKTAVLVIGGTKGKGRSLHTIITNWNVYEEP